ncbi:MAG TPA: uroporphyrinogen decarboxylase family protein [Candidatus Deferrimicrobium sp.]|nr:uroporphyrinogen decarboxylase family protein [Candidatus Deferrimicrobium sp.]
MKELTALERVINAIELRDVDRIPVVPQLTYAAGYFINLEIDAALADFAKQKIALLNSQRLGGYDGIYAGWDGSFVLITSSLGGSLKTYPDKPPAIDKPLIANKEDLEKLPALDPTKHGRIPQNLQLIRALKAETKDVPIFSYTASPFTLASLILGINQFMIALMRDKLNILDDLLQYCYQTTLKFAQAKIEAGVDMISIADPSGSSDLVSPKLFEQRSFPLLKKLITTLKKSGKKIGLHICGQTKPILLKMAETGADYLEIDTKVDLQEAQEMLQGKVCLIGNIFSTDLAFKPAQEIKQQCKELLEKIKSGFILSSGCEVSYSTPLVNIQAMVEAAKEFGNI